MEAPRSIPSQVRLELAPKSVDAYRRRIVQNAVNSNDYTPRTTIKIPMDTSMHGSFLDTRLTQLSFTVKIYNTNPFVDYLDLPVCGFNSIFKEMRVMVNGSAIEQIKDYGLVAETLMRAKNRNPDPYHFFLPNPWSPPAGPTQINFIKPAMVDHFGAPMYVKYQFEDQNPFNFMFASGVTTDGCGQWGVQNPDFELTSDAGFQRRNPAASTALNQTLVSSAYTKFDYKAADAIELNDKTHQFYFLDAATETSLVTNPKHSSSASTASTAFVPSAYTCCIDSTQATAKSFTTGSHCSVAKLSNTFSGFGYLPPGTPPYVRAGHPLTMYHIYGQPERVTTATLAGVTPTIQAETAYYANSNYNPGSVMTSNLTELGVIGDAQTLSGAVVLGGHRCRFSPAYWPHHQPIVKPEKPTHRNRPQDMSEFYSNCKSIPIGLGRSLMTDPYNVLYSKSKGNPSGDYFEFRCSTDIYSGLLGNLAKKHFPDGLVAAGKMWLEFDLIESRTALKLTMDPCRRVPGTVRDFMCYTGRRSGVPRLSGLIEDINPNYIHCALQIPKIERNNDSANTTSKIAISADLNKGFSKTSASNYGGYQGIADMLMGCCYNDNAAMGTAGLPLLNINPLNLNITLKDAFPVTGTTVANVPSTALGAFVPALSGGYGGLGFGDMGLGDCHTNLSNTIGWPMPQYVPYTSPWYKGDPDSEFDTTADYNIAFCNEAKVCFGTWLPRSEPQTKRVLYSSLSNQLGISTVQYDSSPYSGGIDTVYTVSSVELHLEQILLPDSIAESLITSARTGSLQYSTQFVGSCYNNAPQTDSQQLLLPVVAGSCSNIFFVFRSNEAVYTDNAYMYDSYATYNPYTSLTYTKSADCHVGGNYYVQNALNTQRSSGLELYVKVGSNSYPYSGTIKNVSELLIENEKGIESLNIPGYGVNYEADLVPVRTYQTNPAGTNIVQEVNPLMDGFFACFSPVEALDDQTITGNPFWNVIERSEGVSLRGIRACPSGVTNSTTTINETSSSNNYRGSEAGVWNRFTPLQGHFHICVNFEQYLQSESQARSGITIVNNQLFLMSQKMYFASHTIAGSYGTMIVNAIWTMDARVSFEAGGNCVTYF